MSTRIASFAAAVCAFGMVMPSLAADLRDQVRVEVESARLHDDMAPGTYMCAAGHLHVRATVYNTTAATLGRITVGGKAFDAGGKLLGEATAATRQASVAPGDKSTVDLEFLTVGGPLVQQVKKQEVRVIAAPTK